MSTPYFNIRLSDFQFWVGTLKVRFSHGGLHNHALLVSVPTQGERHIQIFAHIINNGFPIHGVILNVLGVLPISLIEGILNLCHADCGISA
jgi:hypothetical protein